METLISQFSEYGERIHQNGHEYREAENGVRPQWPAMDDPVQSQMVSYASSNINSISHWTSE